MIRRALLAAALAAACTPVPRPAILEEVDRTRESAAAKEAESLAPQAALYAAKLRTDAEHAFKEGDRPGAQILGEQAAAAYAHAEVLARLAKADERRTAAAARVGKEQAEFAALEEEQQRIATEADDVEARFRVARDALPLAATEPATPDRERARLAAARALSVEARLLCIAAQMLGPDTPAMVDAFKALDGLDAELGKTPLRPPIDAAVKLRSSCLGELTRARRPATSAAPEVGSADALLDELGRAGDAPARDDRGVVVVLHDVFQGTQMKPEAHDRVATLGQVARAHATFPVLVVAHGSRAAAGHDTARADSVAKVLGDAGAAHVRTSTAGDALPIAPGGRADAVARNERIEIVFVAPAN